ncbi:hypothetical protein A2U01_0062946, partial [Trifolium medium]|nr:hypothetical protein [Trifolium medium]
MVRSRRRGAWFERKQGVCRKRTGEGDFLSGGKCWCLHFSVHLALLDFMKA